MKKKVLFICTHNSARSQMAEGLLNALYRDKYKAYSAGTEPTEVNPYAIKAMAELGIDISKHRPKSIKEFRGKSFDYVVTVCDHAKETCPFFPGEEILHKGFEDPSEFKGDENEIMEKVRQVRDEIKLWIKKHLVKIVERLQKMLNTPFLYNGDCARARSQNCEISELSDKFKYSE